MKQCLILCLALFFTLSGTTQQVFFKSAQAFDKEMLADFYGSITLQGNLLLFNATDFQLYAYDANTGSHKWSYKLNRKSNIPPFPVQNRIWANSKDEVVQLDTATGALVKKLTLTSLLTKPVVKGDIVYATGIYDGGCLYAYDMMSDSVLWKRYLAHGCSVEPYYLSDKIVANREGSDWIEIAYSGRLKVPSCERDEELIPTTPPCTKQFIAYTHDKKEIKGKLGEEIAPEGYEEPQISYTVKNTVILSNRSLFVLGDKRKMKAKIDLNSLSDSIEFSNSSAEKILRVTTTTVWMFFGGYMLTYDYQRNKLIQAVDLRMWEPHQLILEGSRLWLISRKDGLLYGLTTE